MEATRPDVVLDASVLIALALDEAQAASVRALLRDAATRISSVNAAEVVDVLTRRHGVPADDVAADVEELLTTVVEPVDASLRQAIEAGELRARHWRRNQRISLADCFVLATAQPRGRIATLDDTLAAVARDEGYEVVPLA